MTSREHELTTTIFINSLSLLESHQLSEGDFCPICLVPFQDILNEKPISEDSAIGVTQLESCGHIFCLKDLVEWIRGMHGNCPTCRHKFLDIQPPSDSDDESSDGGEYIPGPDDEEESLYNYNDIEADNELLTDADDNAFDMETDELEFDIHNAWEQDGDTDPDTDGDSSVIDSDEAFQTDDGTISIHEEEELCRGIMGDIRDDVEQK
ncbi:hypothetical protein E1B28_004402 [Marasmius oreades]|uniref:RING-type domain-containing protein n=1 Tax=Marasmius oreades TaxID=181124 RepID=A0A9P7UYP1_9AGAR|nr:uncharacterized protein E1B28_004402 [Marasmius oreades]KAG7097008.1 hypothetical protein E1B28_004402 [Marasmius oreades]